MTTKLTATQRAQDASWEKHGDNHYARMIDAYALAVRLETLLRDTMHFLDYVPRNEIKKRIGDKLDGPDEVKP